MIIEAPTTGLEAGRVEVRPPRVTDAAAVWELVEATPRLDSNSPYAYLLLCTHFADTSLVARLGGHLAGFVLGYRRPDEGRTAFVWQVAVAEAARGGGLASRMLDAWFAQCARRSDSRFVECSVTPSNHASRALFESFAKRHCAPLHEETGFPKLVFPDAVAHEEEVTLRIGPVPLARAIGSAQEKA